MPKFTASSFSRMLSNLETLDANSAASWSCSSCRVLDLLCFFSCRRRHTRCGRDWSSDVCSSDLALALACGLGAGSARADHLDDSLNNKGQEIVEALRSKGVKNVGVLRFRVKEGNRAETWSAGPLNGNLAVRLENVLVMHAG